MSSKIDQLNQKALAKLESKIRTQFDAEIRVRFHTLAEWLFIDIELRRDFIGFTGNTQRSYCVGFYVKGKLEWVEDAHNIYSRKELRAKIFYGKKVFLEYPYEGNPRAIKGKVYVSNETGFATSLNFLRNFTPKYEYAIVVCTGTEYSQYLENVRGLDVLKHTHDDTPYLSHEMFSRPAEFPF